MLQDLSQQIITSDDSVPLASVNPIKFFSFISKVCLAYPSATASILNFRPAQGRGFGQNSKGFVNWLVNDFILPNMLVSKVKEVGE
mmetsp:Transcript_22045/g.16448  ORF Transcript_22045/g.16448 Transcript_22045/m.16448 type:complete len:86 (+) Transcript_22045:414-671(+)